MNLQMGKSYLVDSIIIFIIVLVLIMLDVWLGYFLAGFLTNIGIDNVIIARKLRDARRQNESEKP